MTFKGPAFPDRKAPGMSMGGGLWPVRYVNYCGGLFEDFDEDEVITCATFRQDRTKGLLYFKSYGTAMISCNILRKKRAIFARVLEDP